MGAASAGGGLWAWPGGGGVAGGGPGALTDSRGDVALCLTLRDLLRQDFPPAEGEGRAETGCWGEEGGAGLTLPVNGTAFTASAERERERERGREREREREGEGDGEGERAHC